MMTALSELSEAWRKVRWRFGDPWTAGQAGCLYGWCTGKTETAAKCGLRVLRLRVEA